MIIKNMRWGYDGGGIACRPVEGNTLVELKVVDPATKRVYFVLNSRMAEFNQIMISETLFGASEFSHLAPSRFDQS